MVVILDYGIGNINSILNMFRKISVPAVISSDPFVIEGASKIILPGVGHFDYCMQQLKQAAFFDTLQEQALQRKVPVLGVCVGCQMLMESSEEGREPGLAWISGRVIRFRTADLNKTLKVPHMGWTDVQPKNGCMLYNDISEPRFYFVHSYHIQCAENNLVTATAHYGYDFTASVQQKNIMGVQFHPEKSHKFGMKLYENFVKQY